MPYICLSCGREMIISHHDQDPANAESTHSRHHLFVECPNCGSILEIEMDDKCRELEIDGFQGQPENIRWSLHIEGGSYYWLSELIELQENRKDPHREERLEEMKDRAWRAAQKRQEAASFLGILRAGARASTKVLNRLEARS